MRTNLALAGFVLLLTVAETVTCHRVSYPINQRVKSAKTSVFIHSGGFQVIPAQPRLVAVVLCHFLDRTSLEVSSRYYHDSDT